MADGLFTASDLVKAYERVDVGKVSDINRILAALPGGAGGSYTLADLQGVGSPPRGSGGTKLGGQILNGTQGSIREMGLTGLSSRSLGAWQRVLSDLGSAPPGGENATAEGLTASQTSLLQLEQQALQQAMAFAAERAKFGKKLGGEISDISRGFLSESTPLRKALIGSTESKLGLPISKGATVSPVALFGPSAPERAALETQFANARQQILENTPERGGQLNQALAALPEDRARAISSMEAAATDKAMGLATDIGLGTRPIALAGLTSGANIVDQGLGGAGNTTVAAGLGFGNAASGYSDAANRAQNYTLAQQGFDFGLQQMLSQENMQNSAASGAKKGSTGQAAGAGGGAILGAVIVAI